MLTSNQFTRTDSHNFMADMSVVFAEWKWFSPKGLLVKFYLRVSALNDSGHVRIWLRLCNLYAKANTNVTSVPNNDNHIGSLMEHVVSALFQINIFPAININVDFRTKMSLFYCNFILLTSHTDLLLVIWHYFFCKCPHCGMNTGFHLFHLLLQVWAN